MPLPLLALVPLAVPLLVGGLAVKERNNRKKGGVVVGEHTPPGATQAAPTPEQSARTAQLAAGEAARAILGGAGGVLPQPQGRGGGGIGGAIAQAAGAGQGASAALTVGGAVVTTVASAAGLVAAAPVVVGVAAVAGLAKLADDNLETDYGHRNAQRQGELYSRADLVRVRDGEAAFRGELAVIYREEVEKYDRAMRAPWKLLQDAEGNLRYYTDRGLVAGDPLPGGKLKLFEKVFDWRAGGPAEILASAEQVVTEDPALVARREVLDRQQQARHEAVSEKASTAAAHASRGKSRGDGDN